MVYKRIFYGIIGMMWTVGAHCSVDGGKLTYQEFPKTENDLSFVELMRLKAEGYKPYFEKQVYYPIKLNLDDGGGASKQEIDKCPDVLPAFGAQSAVVGALEDVSEADKKILEKFNKSVVVGGMKCEYNKQIPDDYLSYTCIVYCQLTDKDQQYDGDICFYSNSISRAKVEDQPDASIVNVQDDVDLYFAEPIDETYQGEEVSKGTKLGKIKDKANFYYCVYKK